MKCLQCGTELDRLSKWRGSSEYCSEECKKANQEEFNRLAMSRLMQPRPARTSARAVASTIRVSDNASGTVTAVTHPVGVAARDLSEPPEAAFIIDVFAALSAAQVDSQAPLEPRPVEPLIPAPELPIADSLLAMQSILRGMRPSRREERVLPPVGPKALALVVHPKTGLALPEPPLEWPASLGTAFHVIGLDSVPFTGSRPQAPSSLRFESAGTAMPAGALEAATEPVPHRAIPTRRPARDLPEFTAFLASADYLVHPPSPSAPRLRIHLPKPVLQPYRPRYAFSPRVVEEPESEVVPLVSAPEPSPAPVEAALEPKPAPVPEKVVEEKRAPRPDPVAAPKAQGKQARKYEAKSEPDRTPRPELRHERAAARPAAASQPVSIESVAPNAEPEVAPQKKLELVPKVETRKEEPPAAPVAPSTLAAPSFGGKADVDPESEGFFSRMPGWQKTAAAVVLIGVAVAAWAVPAFNRNARQPKVSAVMQTSATMGPESWETDSSGDTAGIARRRVISLYKPARTKRNYIFEFTGHVEQRAMGWVFRMKDPRNYYCLKLEHTGNGTGTAVQLVKFAVVNGEEQPHRLVSIAEPIVAGQPVRIRLDVRGQNFSTQVNGRPVDVWIDNQIAEGTVGFSNESGERAVIRTVKVSY